MLSEEAPESLTGVAVKAGTSLAVMIGLEYGLVLVRTLVLSRLLEPREFGLVGMAFLAMNVSEVLSQTGFNAAIVQRRGDPAPFLHTLWSVSAARGLALTALTIAAAPLMGDFFRTPDVVPVLRVSAAAMTLRGLISPSWFLLERDLKLVRFTMPRTVGAVVDVVVTIGLSITMRDVWALVIGYLAGTSALLVLTYVAAPYAPRLAFHPGRLRELYGFGKHVFSFEVVAWLSESVDRLAVGRLRDASSLGLFNFAARMSSLPMQVLHIVVARVLFPAFARIQAEPDRVREAFVRLLGLVAITSFPVAAGMLATAPETIAVFLGPSWVPMTTAFQELCVAAVASAFLVICASVGGSIGRPELATRSSVVKLALLGALIVPATLSYGIEGAALATMVGSVAAALHLLGALSRVVGVGMRRCLSALAVPAASSAVLLGAVFGIRAATPAAPALMLVLLVLGGTSAYVASVAVIDRLSGGGHAASVLGLIHNR